MRCIIDKKTGTVEKWAALQTAAYSLLQPETAGSIVFNEDPHAYFMDGVELPSVTSILKKEGFIKEYPKTLASMYYMKRGSLVHQATHLDDLGVLDEDTLDPILVPYVEAWRRFRRESGFVVLLSEVAMANMIHRYAGKPDVIGEFPTGHLKRAAVELHNDGTYKLFPYTDRDDVNIWLAIMTCHNHRERFNNG